MHTWNNHSTVGIQKRRGELLHLSSSKAFALPAHQDKQLSQPTSKVL